MVALPLEKIADLPDCEKAYLKLRAFSKFLSQFYSLSFEGELPKERPAIIAPPHQNHFDPVALVMAIDEYVGFVYVYNLKAKIASSISGIHLNGVRTKVHGLRFKRFFEFLDRKYLVAAFPQGTFQKEKVISFKSGIARLVQDYNSLRQKNTPFIPAGIEYKSPNYLPDILPIPFTKIPLPGTSVTVRFGKPKYLDGRTPKELTEIVMREAAELSNIPYKVQPT